MKSIKELSKDFNISSRTIRYYEESFNLNSIKILLCHVLLIQLDH